MTDPRHNAEGSGAGTAPGPFPMAPVVVLIVLVLLGAAGFLAGLRDPAADRTWAAFTANFLFWTGLSLGAVLFLAVTNLTGARWPRDLRCVASAFASFLPFAVVLFLVLLAGVGRILHHGATGADGGHPWLRLPILAARDGIGLLALSALAGLVVRRTLPSRDGPGRTAPPKTLSVLYILAYAAVLTSLAVDLVMAQDLHWMSTLYPPYFFASSFYVGLAATTALASLPKGLLPPALRIGPDQRQDLSNLTLGFGLFTAYMFYTQVLVIWYGNLPSETSFLIRRAGPDWGWAVLLVLLWAFALPLAVLPLRRVKRSAPAMFAVSLFLLAGMWLERFLAVAPAAGPAGGFPLGFYDVTVTLGFLGLAGLGALVYLHRLAACASEKACPEPNETSEA